MLSIYAALFAIDQETYENETLVRAVRSERIGAMALPPSVPSLLDLHWQINATLRQ
jgi:hypothetical protein